MGDKFLYIFNSENYKFTLSALVPLVSSIFVICLGSFVFLKNIRSKINLLFLMFCISTSIWLFGTFMMFMVQTDELAIFWDRFIYFGVIFIPVFMHHFSIIFTGIQGQRRLLFWGYLLGTSFLVISRTDYFVAGLYKYKWGCHAIAQPFHHLFLLYFWGGVVLLNLNIYRYYKSASSSIDKSRSKYVLIAFLALFLIGAPAYLPAYKVPIYPFPFLSGLFFTILLAVAVIKYRLLDINTVIHRTALWVVTSTLIFFPLGVVLYFVHPFLSNLSWLQLTFLSAVLVYVYLYFYPKIQPRIDHLFRRRKYDYYEVLSEIGQKIGSELELENVQSRLFKELKEILYIRNGVLWVQLSEIYQESGSIGYEKQKDISNSPSEVPLSLSSSSKLSQFISKEQEVLEREQVEADPQYKEIKEEALEWFQQKEIEILIPIVLEEKVNGLLGIGRKENLQAYTQKDIELLAKMGRQLGITLDNALHHQDIMEKELLAGELKLGRDIQRNLLPQVVPETEGLKVMGLMQPAKDIGGDYYDFLDLTKKKTLAILIGDVSGKGVGAGLIMATAKSAIEALTEHENNPKDVLVKTNKLLQKYTRGEKFMTMLYLEWDSVAKKMRYSSAGHEHIIIYRKQMSDKSERAFSINCSVEVIPSGGIVLGMFPEIEQYLENKELTLNPGDKVVLYTDGVTEAHNEKEEMYELKRLTEAVKKHGHKPPEELLTSIKEEVYSFIGKAEQYDDITLVVMEKT